MDVYQLQVFSAVYKHRSFSKASAELHITQPSVSAHVKKLEEELNVQLFDRVGRKVIPTREGDLLHIRAEEVIQKFGDIKRDLMGTDDEIKGLLTVGTGSATGEYILPHMAAEFSKVHPNVFFQVKVKSTERITGMLVNSELLLGIIEKKGQGGLEYLHKVEDELVLVSAPGFIGKKVINPLKLFSIPLIMREEGSDARKSMEQHHFLHKISLKALKVTAILGSTDSIKEAVKSGLGASVLSRFAVKDDLKAGLLEEVKIRGVKMKRNVYVVKHKKRTLPPHYAAFVDFLKERMSV